MAAVFYEQNKAKEKIFIWFTCNHLSIYAQPVLRPHNIELYLYWNTTYMHYSTGIDYNIAFIN